ncbi:Receptor-type guanylate cyclase gcy [Seminavis robusta]|uniref:Receptor-type guanylate cyclase gcy n=1 Tax=Seminavis robusta TaxID=568900 RepID=A0A9N8DYW6_9STRA|nr:Receptor-type guanylate cyclase gcy [Seminavis robusta]|eukprot:Sro478_g151000.1 Receptor-type guanylate cyclase gcy (1228) ;mRNA; f:22981-27882
MFETQPTDAESLDISDEFGEDDDDDDPEMARSGASLKSNESKCDENAPLAEKETQFVSRLREVVFGVLLVAAVLICVSVYHMSSRSEREEFETYYDGAAERVMQTFYDIGTSKLGAVSSLGLASVSGNWPFVIVERFQQRAAAARQQSGALLIHVNPIVTDEQRPQWESFVANASSQWIEDATEYQDNIEMLKFAEEAIRPNLAGMGETVISDNGTMPIWDYNSDLTKEPVRGPGPYMPVWQTSPLLLGGLDVNKNAVVNFDEPGANVSYHTESLVIGGFQTAPEGGVDSKNVYTSLFALLLSVANNESSHYSGAPFSQVFFPVYETYQAEGAPSRKPVAIMTAWIQWCGYFDNVLPSTMKGIYVIFHNSCSESFTYEINGPKMTAVGPSDRHDPAFDHMRRSASLTDTITHIADGSKYGIPVSKEHCAISIDVYPSQTFFYQYNTSYPLAMTIAIGSIFLFTVAIFFLYDRLVERRQKLVMDRAVKTNAIVTSLFPENVRDRLMQQTNVEGEKKEKESPFNIARSTRLRGYLQGQQEDDFDQAPIADLFPHCTVLFADIAGFTAWSSTRDPAQVFILLQTLYQAFDKIANRRKVFKVETIGDSYVAVTGLPEPQEMHAVIMARFAIETQRKLNQILPQLESTLGPDTADLSMRYGLHSGPVTAGVLRGERARFQLFGDTVNTAARMESNGIKGKIQVSQSTRDLLVEAGKASWVTPRPDPIKAKGKGVLKTYFVEPPAPKDESLLSGHHSASTGIHTESSGGGSVSPTTRVPVANTSMYADKRRERLVNWIADLLQEHMKQLVATRESATSSVALRYSPPEGATSLDEVAEVIVLPGFSSERDTRGVEVDSDVLAQLLQYVGAIAGMYHENPFHNFEHACHVTMACNKFMQRIVDEDVESAEASDESEEQGSGLSKTHGIHSDPLTLLAIVLSALIHDCDHRGVSNARLAVEDEALGCKYKNQSVAEQNSLDLAWDLLMGDDYEALRLCLFTTEAELKRFRQVLVNMVLATDIFDKELNDLRRKRWEKAFSADCKVSHEENRDLRNTIVIEHIIQASDVSHTMQHWHIYRKWNKRLFRELSLAYSQGRMAKDPSEFWYQGEIGFFDNYVIPLAKKLKDCQVFGVSSDECLDYAIQNRDEWKEKGEALVEQMKDEIRAEKEKRGSFTSQAPLRPEPTTNVALASTKNHESFQESNTEAMTLSMTSFETSSASLSIIFDDHGRRCVDC